VTGRTTEPQKTRATYPKGSLQNMWKKKTMGNQKELANPDSPQKWLLKTDIGRQVGSSCALQYAKR